MPASPIIEFYIKNYKWNGSTVTAENLFQTVPVEGIPVITNPKVKCEMGKAGSFEFGLEQNSPYYNSLMQMNTLLRITYFGNTIFRGRVLTIDKTLTGSRTVHCEGDLTFLMDTYQPGTKEDTRPKIGVLAYLQQIINQHNSEMAPNSYKRFTLGEVPGQYTSATPLSQRVNIPTDKAVQAFGDTSWNTTMDRIEGLLSDFGGFFHTRYDTSNTTTYLDWHDNYYNETTNTQTIEIRQNLIDISGSTEIDNIFTYVVPIGKNENENVFIDDYWPIAKSGHARVNYITVPELATVPLYTDAELNSGYHHKSDYQNAVTKFGRVWKIVNFDNADTSEKLFAYAKDWIKNNYMPEITQWDVTALDLKIVDSTKRCLLCGDRVTLGHQEVDSNNSTITIISADLDLYNPDKNKYTIGIPNQQINASYGVKKKTDKSKGGSGGTISAGGGQEPPPEDPKLDIEKIKSRLEQMYFEKTEWGGDITLDDPLAFLLYNTDGTEKTKAETLKEHFEYTGAIRLTKLTKGAQILQEALLRGVSKDDPQLLIDLTPTVKSKQTTWKQTSGFKFTHDYGLTQQEAEVLLNEGPAWLSTLVDDDGNWTESAYARGCTMWAGANEIKQQAINARKILSGEKKPAGASVLTGTIEEITGFEMDIGGGFATVKNACNDAMTQVTQIFGTGDTFNVEELIQNGVKAAKQFSLTSDSMEVDGTTGDGKIAMGVKENNQWPITLNHPITYTDGSGTTHTLTQAIYASDYSLKNIGSVRADLLATEILLADYAQIDTLVSLNSRIGTLEATKITADDVTATLIATKLLNSSVLSTNYIFSSQMEMDTFTQDDYTCYVPDAITAIQIVQNGDTYSLQRKRFTESTWVTVPGGNFSRATSLSGEWSGTVAAGKAYKVTASPQGNVCWSPNLDQIYPSGSQSWASDYKSFTQLLKVCDEDGVDLYQDTLPFSTIAAYNAGYNQACADVGITGPSGTTGTVYVGTWYGTLYVAPTGGAQSVPNCLGQSTGYQLTRK